MAAVAVRSTPAMADEGSTTRDKLLDAAARLFAERGIESVSIAEIVREAGQRNASAVHYHFGGRDEILLAVLERHVPTIRERRLELLERARATPDDDLRAVAEALVRPVTEFAQRGWRERAYLQIGSELTPWLHRTTPEIGALLHDTAGHEVMALFAERFRGIPDDVWAERTRLIYPFIGRSAADRARLLDQPGAEQPVLADDRFVDNLVDMVLGALTAPVGSTAATAG
jgi:AcrR family transcriptional regulator